ncbi:hypothetical protein DTO195F2_2329 [Paecilomyces variotii]|nr:hypothetical protein DTO195F2_2329 [Paecilomyces variotii]KAJ9370357.1 hypothetical protein DTO282E5_4898 [Paecilomyces variotii]
MSSPQNGLHRQHLISPSDGRPSSHESSSPLRQDRDYDYAASEPRDSMQMDDGRKSGELEGSTLGSSSREGERRKRHRQSQRSGGFLLDTPFIPSSKLLRSTPQREHQQQPQPTGAVKREAPEPEIVVPKRKSRRPWHRHKHSVGSSPLATAVTNASNAEEIPQHTLEPSGFTPNTHAAHRPASATIPSPVVGLDTDPAQIVNLALNLSESRRRNYASRFPSTPVPTSRKISQPSFALAENNAHRLSGGYWQQNSYGPRSPSYAQPVSAYRSGPRHAYTIPREFSDTTSLAPIAIDNDSQSDYEFSDATLARAEKARNHFELFFEYLRLLPHLPPLRPSRRGSSSSSESSAEDEALTGRVYNPLQCIRNRKVRYREKCPIDTEAEGWQDVSRVHEWVNAIEARDETGLDDPDTCVRLPPFQYTPMGKREVDEKDADRSTTSPSSSTRRPFGTSNVKTRRPRLDWIVTPAELLADAAWLEDPVNKAKILDKDNNKLYPNPTMLKHVEWKISHSIPSEEPINEEQEAPETGRYDLSGSLPNFQRSTQKGRHVGRGRHRHRLHESLRHATSPSSSDKDGKSSWRKSLMRSDSSSSDTSDDESWRGRARHSHWRQRLHGVRERPRDDDQPRRSESLTRQSQESSRRNDMADGTTKKDASGAAYASSVSPPELRVDRGRPPAVKRVRTSMSSTGTIGDREDVRKSLEDQDSTAPNSPLCGSHFPSIAVNLSPPSSRSPSPTKKALPKLIGSLHERSRSKQRNKFEFEAPVYDTSPESPTIDKRRTLDSIDPLERVETLEPVPATDAYPASPEGRGSIRREGPKANKLSQESKLRGIFKGGRIAELVGNEVSKVGDLIRKKDSHGHSRKSSSASSIISDYNDSDDEKGNGGPKPGAKNIIKRLPTFSDDNGRLSRKETEKDMPRTVNPNLPTFTSPFKHDGDNRKSSDAELSSGLQGASAEKAENTAQYGPDAIPQLSPGIPKSRFSINDRRDSYGFRPALNVWGEQISPGKGQNRDTYEPYVHSRPPVTGLANADVSSISSRKRRPIISTRAWSISERSITTIGEPNLTDKKEIERVKALLLSSGIKAREICRRAESVRSPPPEFLIRSLPNPDDPVPCFPEFEKFDCAAKNFVRTFESRRSSLRQSMDRFSGVTSPSLKSELEKLETLVSQSLTPRVRAAAIEAEALTTQLNTTSTLAIKELSDALDRGVRKRNRRFRWVRRTGFVLLEWLLVGVMWWVWLIVMIFKVGRGIWRATVSSIRWVLWL